MKVAIALCAALTYTVMYSGKFAWASPGAEPAWVEKRLDAKVQ